MKVRSFILCNMYATYNLLFVTFGEIKKGEQEKLLMNTSKDFSNYQL
jgi:hypothetical protein